MKPQHLLLCLAISLATLPAYALLSDSSQPLHISSDRFTYYDAQSLAIYSGRVVGTQGSRRLTADTVKVHLDQNKNISDVDAFGKPAHYDYLPSPKSTRVNASANHIQYVPNSHLLSLQGNATITQQGNVFKGNTITYDTNTQVVQSSGSENDTNRPLMIIQPEIQAKATPHVST